MRIAHWLSRRISRDGPAYRVLARIYRAWQALWFRTSGDYWERRYARGGDSGEGSYGRSAEFKAEFLNDFFRRHGVSDVIELGHGDGAQAARLDVQRYRGYDVSATAVANCRNRFSGDPRRTFELVGAFGDARADTALSLDVVFHLVEDRVYEDYMRRLFDCAERFVIVYSTNSDEASAVQSPHVRHRAFTPWVAANRPDFRFVSFTPSPVHQPGEPVRQLGFHVFERRRTAS